MIFYSLRVLAGDPNPQGFFDYPGLFLYALAALFRGAIWTAHPFGGPSGPAEAVESYLRGDPALFTMAARGLNAALGVLTVLLVYRMGRRRGGIFIGAAAAGLLALNRLHILQSHYGTVDVAAVLLSLLALDRILEFWETGAGRDGAWAALLTGLAAAVKYYPAALLALLLPAPFLLGKPGPLRTAAGWTGLAVAGFFLGSPFALLSPLAFADRFAHLFPKIVGLPAAAAGGPFFPTVWHLIHNAGPAVLFFSLWSIVDALRARAWTGRVLAASALLLFFFFGLWVRQAEHYALLLYPILFLLSAQGLRRLDRFHRSLPALMAALMAALALPSTVRQARLLARPDTRLEALAWLRTALPAGSRVLRFAHTPEFTSRDPFRVKVDWENKLLEGAGREGDREIFRSYDYILYSSYGPETDGSLAYLEKELAPVRRFAGPPPQFPHHPVVYVFRGAASAARKESS